MAHRKPQDDAVIRIATVDDHPTVVRMLCHLVDELDPSEGATQVKERLHDDIINALRAPTIRIFLAENNTESVGLSRADILTQDPIFRLRGDNRCGYVDQMYVLPSYRSRGLGERLLRCCEDWFREQGIRHSLLHAAPKAVRFYARSGYQPNREMFKRL